MVDSDSMGVMWTPTGLSSGDEARVTVSVNTATQHADPRVGFANTATMVVRDPYLQPVVSKIICTPEFAPQEGNDACTATLDAPGGRGHIVNLAVTASDPNGDDLEYLWRSTNGSLVPRGDQAAWSAEGLSTRTYIDAVSVSVNDRHFNVQENVTLNVVRYVDTEQEPDAPVACDRSTWPNGTPRVGDAYCGQRHDARFTRFTGTVGEAGEPEIELESVTKSYYLRKNQNRIPSLPR